MPIIDLKKFRSSENGRGWLTALAVGLLIPAVLFYYFGSHSETGAGVVLMLALIVSLEYFFLKLFLPKILKDPSEIILAEIIFIIMLLVSVLIEKNSALPSYFMPVGSAAVLLGILTPPLAAAVNVLVISMVVCAMGDFSLGYFLVLISGGLAGVYSARNVRNRKDLNMCGLWIMTANIAAIFSEGLFSGTPFMDVGVNIGWGAANALVSVIIASGLLPLLESVFGITTNIRLLEIGDFNNPLLKRLMLEAPGTYHHSLMVGNLAENACEKIGANALLARVGAYYHDIGKLRNPQYFIENQVHRADMHKNLKPNISSLILKRHVKDGLALAEEYKLDRVIRDFISQHHGTTLIEFFYKKVLDDSGEKSKIDEKEYRYPGPPPTSREAGVLMLADSVEAACRTLEEPTFSRISGLVRKVITGKFIDQQLNHCGLTLANLEDIQKSFTNTLAGIYHSRIEYPEDKEENTV